MNPRFTIEDVIHKAHAFKALNFDEVYLDEPPYPWNAVYSIEPGGSHRLEIATNIWFYAKVNDIIVRWSLDIEPRSANGKGYYMIDTGTISAIMYQLPPRMIGTLKAYFKDCAEKVQRKGNEYRTHADNQQEAATKLLQLANL